MLHFRPEIDGLRAIAVVAVMLFHAGVEPFAGGFIGVDVFFVISGFLITSIIASRLDEGSFSVLEFYERRARRILPALFVVMLVSAIAAIFILPPSDLENFSKSLVASSLFISNFEFWAEAGYFDTAAELKPLIHTWSLAIEEQYYLLAPLFMLYLWRFGRTVIVAVTTIVVVSSFGLAEWSTQHYPAASFFLPHTRIWELAIGSLIATLNLPHAAKSLPTSTRQTLSLLGIAMISYAIFTFDQTTLHPGFVTLLPVLGTAAIIIFATPDTIIGQFLASRPLTGVGLISYSAYLWHQPVLALARHQSSADLSTETAICLCVLSTAMAFLSWRYIEQPCRNTRFCSQNQIFKYSAIAMSVGVVWGAIGNATSGFERVYVANFDDRQRLVWQASGKGKARKSDCVFNVDEITAETEKTFIACAAKYGPAVVVLGDSHARNVFRALSKTSNLNFIFGYAKGNCPVYSSETKCALDQFLSFNRKFAKDVRYVVYIQAGFPMMEDADGIQAKRTSFKRRSASNYLPDDEIIVRTIVALAEISRTTPVSWLGPWIEPHFKAGYLLSLALKCSSATVVIRPDINEAFQRLDERIRSKLGDARDFAFISSIDALKLDAATDLYDCTAAYWEDEDHLTEAGEVRFGKRIVSALAAEGFSTAAQTDTLRQRPFNEQ